MKPDFKLNKSRKEVQYKEEEAARMKKEIEADFERRKMAWEDQISAENEFLVATNREVQIRHEQLEREMDNELGLPLEDPIRKLKNIDGSWVSNRNISGLVSSQ